MTSLCLAVFLASILLSFLLTRVVRAMAILRGWASVPSSGRHVHNESIPRLGGVAIFLSFATVIGLLLIVISVFKVPINISAHTVLYILASATAVFLIGLYDDFVSIGPYLKFAVQAAAGAVLFYEGFQVFQFPLLFGEHRFGWVALPLTIVWVLWITNAFNLIDGIDGLAAGSALFSTIVVFVVSLVSNNQLVSLLTVALAGSILGFLRFNFNPATIFLGDCGSLFIGFMLSALALAGAQKTPTIVAVAIPIVSFGLPILETILSVIRRFIGGQPLFVADREHIHHMLLDRGLSQRQVVIILYAVSALCGLLSLFLLYPSGPTVGIVLFVVGAGIWLGVQHLGYNEFFELKRVAQRTMDQKKIIKNNLAIRRATRALLKAQNFEQLYAALKEAFESNDFDGFLLCLSLSQTQTTIDATRECVGLDHNGCLSWHKANGFNPADPPLHAWTLTLDLASSKKQKLGHLSLYRAYSNNPLLADINLLTSEFQVTLAETVERISGQQESKRIEETEAARPARI